MVPPAKPGLTDPGWRHRTWCVRAPTPSRRSCASESGTNWGRQRGAGRLARPLGGFLAAASSCGGVGGCGVAGEGFGTGSGVPLKGAHGGVPGPGEQHRGVGATLSVVGQCRVAQLVQGPPCRLPGGGREGCGGVCEQFGSAPVGQSGPAGVGAHVQGGHRPGWGPARRGTPVPGRGRRGVGAAAAAARSRFGSTPSRCPRLWR